MVYVTAVNLWSFLCLVWAHKLNTKLYNTCRAYLIPKTRVHIRIFKTSLREVYRTSSAHYQQAILAQRKLFTKWSIKPLLNSQKGLYSCLTMFMTLFIRRLQS